MLPGENSYHDGVGRCVISGVLGVLFPNLRKSELKPVSAYVAFLPLHGLNDHTLTLLIAPVYHNDPFSQPVLPIDYVLPE